MTRVLGIDLGMKRVGLALSDELRLSVRPLPIHHPKSRKEDVEMILNLCQEWHVSDVVIGLALLTSGDLGSMGKRATGLAEAIRQEAQTRQITLSVHLLDESNTSKVASQMLAQLGVPLKKRKAMLDAEVACHLVEQFLATRPSGE